MKRIMPIRKKIGRRTIFNLMGPLANPARVTRQLIGIARPAYVPSMPRRLHRLGTEHSRVVSGDEGLDELSLAGGNEVAVVTPEARAHAAQHRRRRRIADRTRSRRFAAATPGITPAPCAACCRASAAPIATRCCSMPPSALVVAGDADNLVAGVEEAAEAIDKGLANALLDCWIAYK